MTGNRTDHFKLQELVDRVTFEKYGQAAWSLFNPLALEALDGVRGFFGVPVTVNNWHLGGPFQYRGYRPPDCKTGAFFSDHKRGNAFDSDVRGYTAEEARKAIMTHQENPLLKKITRLEGGVTWLHMDCGAVPSGKTRIYVFTA